MNEPGVRLDDVVLGSPADDAAYRSAVHPADRDDLEALVAVSEVPGVYTILKIADADADADADDGWRLVEHRPTGRAVGGRHVFARWDVTERERARVDAARAESYRNALLREGVQAMAVLDPRTLRIAYVTDELAALVDRSATTLIGSRAQWHVDRRDISVLRRLLGTGRPPGPTELRVRCAGGDRRWVEVSFGSSDPDALVVAVRDIEQRMRAQERLRSSERLFRLLVDQVGDGVIVVDDRARMSYLSDAAARALGDTVVSLTGAPVPLCEDTEHPPRLRLGGPTNESRPLPLHRLPAEAEGPGGRWFDVAGHDLTEDPVVAGWVLVLRDVTERRDRMERLRAELERDPLTHLLNRRGFETRVTERLRAGSTVGLGFLDLDGFKQVNDEHGHAVGDELLSEVAARLRRGVRPGDEVARFGGDEFAVAFLDLPSHAGMIELTSRLVDATRGRYEIGATAVEIGVSAGWTVALPGESFDDALGRADRRMYQQKRGRR